MRRQPRTNPLSLSLLPTTRAGAARPGARRGPLGRPPRSARQGPAALRRHQRGAQPTRSPRLCARPPAPGGPTHAPISSRPPLLTTHQPPPSPPVPQVLRLHPPVIFGRMAMQDIQLGKYLIPKASKWGLTTPRTRLSSLCAFAVQRRSGGAAPENARPPAPPGLQRHRRPHVGDAPRHPLLGPARRGVRPSALAREGRGADRAPGPVLPLLRCARHGQLHAAVRHRPRRAAAAVMMRPLRVCNSFGARRRPAQLHRDEGGADGAEDHGRHRAQQVPSVHSPRWERLLAARTATPAAFTQSGLALVIWSSPLTHLRPVLCPAAASAGAPPPDTAATITLRPTPFELVVARRA